MPYAQRPRDAELQKVIDRIGLTTLAAAMDPPMQKQAIYAWRQVPEARLKQVSRISGVSLHKLRPDIYARNGRKRRKGWTANR